MSPHSDLDLEDSKQIFMHDTLAHNDASQFQVWLQKVQSWEDIVQMNMQEFFYLSYDLDLDHNRAIQSFHKTIHLMIMRHQTKFSCKRISSSDIKK